MWAEQIMDHLNSIGAGLRNIWMADTEFYGADGDVPHPVCSVFLNPVTGQTIKQFYEVESPYPPCPVDLGKSTLFIAFAAQAELMTFIQLGWGMPQRILDLFIEWRHLNNEEFRLKAMKSVREHPGPFSLLGACSHFGIRVQSSDNKDEMRDLILRGHPYSLEEQEQILSYCEEDVRETAMLVEKMWRDIPDLKSAVFRGASARGFSWARTTGIPMDVTTYERLRGNWPEVLAAISGEVRQEFPVFNPGSPDISPNLWREYLERRDLQEKWPKTGGGKGKNGAKPQPKRDEKTLRTVMRQHPEFETLHEYLAMRACTKLGLQFPVGKDGRSRVHFWDFGTVTSRCSPSTKKFVIAGGSPAFRHLVRPREGEVLIEMDWSAQEIWIAAYLSGDPAMKRMLAHGDPYVAFGAMAKLLPPNATKNPEKSPYWEADPDLAREHSTTRNRLKAVALGVLYGKTPFTIADEEGMPLAEAKRLLQMHRRLFPVFWRWITGVVSEAMATRRITTRFGWTRQLLPRKERERHLDENGRMKKLRNSLQNFHMQSHGAEMLRLALIYAADDRLPICAPLHDAIFAVAATDREEQVVEALKACMNRASRAVIGVEVPVEVKVTRYPDRYVPEKKPKAIETWERMLAALQEIEKTGGEPAHQPSEFSSDPESKQTNWRNPGGQNPVNPQQDGERGCLGM